MRVKIDVPKDRRRYRVEYTYMGAEAWTTVIAKTEERARNKFLRNFGSSCEITDVIPLKEHE